MHTVYWGRVVRAAGGDIVEIRLYDRNPQVPPDPIEGWTRAKLRVRPKQFRLYGVDAPEKGQPFGIQAQKFLSRIAGGEDVLIKYHGKNQDGMRVGDVAIAGESLSRELVRAGMAWWDRNSAPEASELKRLQAEARQGRRGLWVDGNPVAPWKWIVGKPSNPLNKRLSVHITSGSIRSYLDQVAAQSRLHFRVIEEGLAHCIVTAFLHNVTARECLQVLLEVQGLTYQSGGRSNHYLVSARMNRPVCPRVPPAKRATGACRPEEGRPLSLACDDGPLWSFAKIVADQGGANFVITNGGEEYPITAQFEAADIEEVLGLLRSNASLVVEQFGPSKITVVTPEKSSPTK